MEPERTARIHKVDSRLQRSAYGWAALVMSLPFVAIGAFFALAGFGVIPLPGKANAPLWVIGTVGITFALGGLLLLGHALRGIGLRLRAARLRRRFAGQPWFLDYPWEPAGIADSPSGRWVGALLGLLLMGTLLVPFNWLSFFSRDGHLMVQVVTGLFDLVLVLLLAGFVYRLGQALKFGRSRLSFAHFPFQPGEELRVGFSPNRFERLKVTLRFVEEWFESSGSGRHRHVSQRSVAHWSESRTLTPDPRGAEVPISFRLPDNPAWVNQLTADPRVRYWELLLEADQPGIDFRTTFPLPV